MNLPLSVHIGNFSEADWPFRDGRPVYYPKLPNGRVARGAAACLDPFPAYAHDADVVRRTLHQAASWFPPVWPVHTYILDREELARTNGYSILEHDYAAGKDAEGRYPKLGIIALSGKRIPPDPETTKYVVAHEYGHHVEWFIEHLRDPESVTRGKVIEEYAELRGGAISTHHGSGGRWHSSATEVFACDFRVLIAGIRRNYWPHPGIAHPTEVRALEGWWADATALVKG